MIKLPRDLSLYNQRWSNSRSVHHIILDNINISDIITHLLVLPGHSVLNPETACQSVIYSGGGFSNYFATPDYQKSQVQGYLANYPPSYTGAQYNNTGTSRGFPDLSANGANYVVSVWCSILSCKSAGLTLSSGPRNIQPRIRDIGFYPCRRRYLDARK